MICDARVQDRRCPLAAGRLAPIARQEIVAQSVEVADLFFSLSGGEAMGAHFRSMLLGRLAR